MREEAYRTWLKKQKMGERPQGDAFSRCYRVERDLSVDFDQEYKRDKGKSIISRLEYTRDDAEIDAPLPGNIVIDGNKYTGMSSLRSACKKYFLFCDEVSP